MNNKLKTFIGFAIRSKKYKIGGNAINTIKKAHLIIVCKSAGESTVKLANKFGKRFNCKVYQTKNENLDEYTFIANGKVMAVTDFMLAKAILENAEKDLLDINGEGNV